MDKKNTWLWTFLFLSDHVLLHLRVFASSAQGRYFGAQFTLVDFMRIEKVRITLKYTYTSYQIEHKIYFTSKHPWKEQ